MTRQQFIKQFGEDPVDMFGEDWKNYIDDLISWRFHFDKSTRRFFNVLVYIPHE